MSKQGEGIFKAKVVADLKATFGDKINILVTQEVARKGVPDLIMCLYGDSIHNELKLDGSRPTPLQQLQLDRHVRAGGFSMASTPSTWKMHLETLKERYKGRT